MFLTTLLCLLVKYLSQNLFGGHILFSDANVFKIYMVTHQKSDGISCGSILYPEFYILQAMQDLAIASRAEMRLNAELEEQSQRIKDFKLQKEQARTKLSTYST